MTVIDVDCHFDLRVGVDDHPFLELVDRLPPLAEFVASAVVGDLQRATPLESRIDPELAMYMLPDANQSAAEQAVMPGQTEPRYPLATPSERGAWLDEVGIDHAFMNPGGGGFVSDFLGDDRARGIQLYNDYMADALDGHTHRMSPVAQVDWTSLDREQFPEMLVFSSDYPHGEGNATPTAIYEPILADVDPRLHASFFGENMLECFKRMGDPLPVAD